MTTAPAHLSGRLDEPTCLTDVLRRRAPEDVLLVTADGTGLTAQQCLDRSTELAARLRAAGIGAGDRVATFQALSAEALLTWWALDRLGAVYLPLNPTWSERLARRVVLDRGPVAVLAEQPWLDLARRAAADTPTAAREAEPLTTGLATADGQAPHDLPEHVRGPLEDCCIVHNSGLPGIHHGVRTSLRSLLTQSSAMAAAHPDARVLVGASPCFAGVLLTVLGAVGARGSAALLPGLTREDFWPAVRRTGVTFAALLNPTTADLLAEPARPGDADSPLTLVAASSANEDVNRAALQRFGFHWTSGMAKTEVCGAVSTDLDPGPEQGMGRVREPFVGRIVDPVSGEEVAAGTTGELVLRCQVEGGLPAGYADDPAASAQLWRGGWLHTGWRVRQDAAGWLHADGELSVHPIVVKRAGYLFVDDLEAEIVGVGAGVTAARVATAPGAGPLDDPLVVAWVTGAVERDELVASLRAGLPAHLVPDHVVAVDALPAHPDAGARPADAWPTAP
ncbi:MAG TPA: AMP-binding protein [Mycobacteriales bacterium]|jgi:crotonobetaine/carnitine-CoA ligase|nr:AMP-binding protein [Mycobacteriales bacterium]